MDADVALPKLNGKHGDSDRKLIPGGRRNLIEMALTATAPPSTTGYTTLSTTGSTTESTTGSTTGSTPTTVNAASETGSRFTAYAVILALSACVLSF